MAAERAWQRMLSGRRLDLLDPSPLDVEIEDIALGLSRVARWNGQTNGDWAYTVAQHSLLVEELVSALKKDLPTQWHLAALLHDGPEYVVGDLITPFKAAVGPGYKDLERRLQSAVHLRFGLPASLPLAIGKLIKRADKMAAYLEATQLAGFSEKDAQRILGRPRNLIEVKLVSDKPEAARRAFLKRFAELSQKGHNLS